MSISVLKRHAAVSECRSFFRNALAPVLFFMAWAFSAQGVENFDTHKLSTHLREIAAAHPDLVRLTQAAESLGKRPVWLIELGRGADLERKRRPAILLVAGIEGNDLAGASIAMHWMKQLVEDDAKGGPAKRLLDSTTVYIFPRLNPDAAESFFSPAKHESSVNSRPVDDDHDGLVNEDGPDDLNRDGLISWMRIEDPEGEFILDPGDARLLMKADKAKGERGQWRYLIEGRDDDHDKDWNEDGAGGVNLNRNFPFNYRYFGPASGLHPVSEIETRALADFIVEHPNIGITFTYGAAENLLQTPKGEPGGKRPPTAIQDNDLPLYRELGKAFREALGLKKELQGTNEPGTFSDWMYYHRGRLSLAAKPWSPALQVELAKSKTDKPKEPGKPKDESVPSGGKSEPKSDDKKESEEPKSDKKPEAKPKAEGENRNEEERAFLKWLDGSSPESFVPWRAFDHPDFPGKKVEIGGFAPFAKSNPPKMFLDELAASHASFLTHLADKLPRVGVRRAEAKHLGESIYEIVVQVENTGYLPTELAQGVTTREVLPTRVTFEIDEKEILAGTKTSMLGPIAGSGGMHEVRCTLRAKGRTRVQVEVISALGGTVKATIPLPNAP